MGQEVQYVWILANVLFMIRRQPNTNEATFSLYQIYLVLQMCHKYLQTVHLHVKTFALN